MQCRDRLAKAGVLLTLALGVSTAAAQTGTTLGPKDGAGLPPTDTARVGIGTQAPDFTLESRRGPRVTLSEYRGKKNVILVFYRGHW